jgi:putative FmdB family regulatory protein
MPIFEYSCQACSHEFELLVRGDAKPVCPACESDGLKKKFSLFVVGGAPPAARAKPPESACSGCEMSGSCAME